MKVMLDLDALVASGKLTPSEAERLKGYAAAETGALGVNVLFGLGATAVASGIGVLIPTLGTVMVLGAVMFALGLGMRAARIERWSVFAQIIMMIGALALVSSVGALYGELLWVRSALTLGLALAGVLAMSGLLTAMAVIGFATTITIDVDLWTPTHYLAIAIIALSALVLGLYLLSLRLAPAYERLVIVAMRTAILLINGAFLIGSVLGDSVSGWSSTVFAMAWALALLAFGVWAMFANRRWVVNVVAIFAAIHFFTQWFIVLGAQPVSILGGGLLLIAFGLGLARFNSWVGAGKASAA